MKIDLWDLVLFIGIILIVIGVGMWSIPAALVVGGVAVAGFGVFGAVVKAAGYSRK